MISALSGLAFRIPNLDYPQIPNDDEVMLCFVEGNYLCKQSLFECLPFFKKALGNGVKEHINRIFHFEEPILVQQSYAFLFRTGNPEASTFTTTVTFNDLLAAVAILIENKTIYDVFSIETLENPHFLEHLITILVYFGNVESRDRLIDVKVEDVNHMPFNLAKMLSGCPDAPRISMIPAAQEMVALSHGFETEQQAKVYFDQIYAYYLEYRRVNVMIYTGSKGDVLQEQRNAHLSKHAQFVLNQLILLKSQKASIRFQANMSRHRSHENPNVRKMSEEAHAKVIEYRINLRGCFKENDSEDILNYLIGPEGFMLEEFNIRCEKNKLHLPNGDTIELTLDHMGPYYLWRDLQTFFILKGLEVPSKNPYEPKIIWRQEERVKRIKIEWIECLLNWSVLSSAQKDQKTEEILALSDWSMYFISKKDIEFLEIKIIEGVRYLLGRHKIVDKAVYFDLEHFKLYFHSPNNLISLDRLKVMQQVNASF